MKKKYDFNFRNYPLVFVAIAFMAAMYIGVFYRNIYPSFLSPIGLALFYHSIFSVAFALGLGLGFVRFRGLFDGYENFYINLSASSIGTLIVIFFLGLGFYGTYSTITYFYTVNEYVHMISSGLEGIRADYEQSADAGGASGYYKLLSYMLNGVFAAMCALREFHGGRRVRMVSIFYWISIILILAKTAVALDRATVFLLFVGMYLSSAPYAKSRLKSILIFCFGFFILNFVSGLRLNGLGIIDFIGLYAIHGLSNFGFVIDSNFCLDYGRQTIFSMLHVILSNIGLSWYGNSCSGFVWSWNPAQYFFSHLYIDFNLFGLLFLVALGYFLVKVDVFSKRSVLYCQALRYHLIVAIIMMIGVTTLRGPEFLVAFISSYLVLRFSLARFAR